MAIISIGLVENRVYRISQYNMIGQIENIIITDNGLYSVYYKKDNVSISKTGKIRNVVSDASSTANTYIVFDSSEDATSIRERIYFSQIVYIKDVTPNNAYSIAVEHGFVGTVDDWLLSMTGPIGSSAYEIAVLHGFKGTESEWLASLSDTTQIVKDIGSLYQSVTWVKGMGILQ